MFFTVVCVILMIQQTAKMQERNNPYHNYAKVEAEAQKWKEAKQRSHNCNVNF